MILGVGIVNKGKASLKAKRDTWDPVAYATRC